MELGELRRKHPKLIYRSYSYKKEQADLVLEFEFLLVPDVYFRPRIIIENAGDLISNVNQELLENMVFHLGLMEIPSYWKTACSPLIEVQAGSLSGAQIKWWKWLMMNGMGEFFYQNQIDFNQPGFLEIIATGSKKFKAMKGNLKKDEFLTLIGGGKDSIVTLEFLKKLGMKQKLLLVNLTQASNRVADLAQVEQKISIIRNIDKTLLEMNRQGYLNGHTPFSAELAFLAILMAELLGGLQIVVSNERSADEENTTYLGGKINHQFSKSYIFEKAIRKYAKEYISREAIYFSLLRPLWEIQIAKIFSRFPEYFKVFLSCNRGEAEGKWCGICPKCLSTFILLYPFLGEKTEFIWSRNLFADMSLLPILEKLTSKDKVKPFECVGTREEMIAGLFLSVKKLVDNDRELPVILKHAVDNILSKQGNLSERANKLMKGWGRDDLLPANMTDELKKMLND